jgi:bifunctional enzyme CysN/CysC
VSLELAPLGVVFVGNVDHGKSTLIARLLLDTGVFPDGRYEELASAAKRRGIPLELSFLLDSLQIERDQAITVDASRWWFRSAARGYAIIDAPGHAALVRNMISGAADASAAVLVIDAKEGVGLQTRRHAALLGLLGVSDVVVAVNKMDLVDDATRFHAIARDVEEIVTRLGMRFARAVPTVARDGDVVVERGERFAWYAGPTLLEALDALGERADDTATKPLRMAVQDVYRRDGIRFVVGHLAAGTAGAGDAVVLQPSGERASIARIVTFPESGIDRVSSGAEIALVLDRDAFVQPGDVIAAQSAPARVVSGFRATTFCLDADGFAPETALQMRIGTRDIPVVVEEIEGRIDFETLGDSHETTLAENDLGIVAFAPLEGVVVDPLLDELKRFALYRNGRIVGGGVVLEAGLVAAVAGRRHSPNVSAVHAGATHAARRALLGQRGVVLWLTGLPASGKSTIATNLERRLIAAGRAAKVLDGDSLRTGLNGDLGFSDADRAENIRRTAEVAALFASAEIITICAMVSPSREDRARARAICGDAFYEVYINADLATCEERDPKGLYRRARAGDLANFTGISAPYEAPTEPDITIASGARGIEENVDDLFAFALTVAQAQSTR